MRHFEQNGFIFRIAKPASSQPYHPSTRVAAQLPVVRALFFLKSRLGAERTKWVCFFEWKNPPPRKCARTNGFVFSSAGCSPWRGQMALFFRMRVQTVAKQNGFVFSFRRAAGPGVSPRNHRILVSWLALRDFTSGRTGNRCRINAERNVPMNRSSTRIYTL